MTRLKVVHVVSQQEDWGELNAGKRPPAIFVLDLAAFSVTHAAGLPADTSAGQPVWTPDGMGPIALSEAISRRC